MSIEETRTDEQNNEWSDEAILRREVESYSPTQATAVILAAERLSNEVEDLLFAEVDERFQRARVRDAWQNYVETADRS